MLDLTHDPDLIDESTAAKLLGWTVEDLWHAPHRPVEPIDVSGDVEHPAFRWSRSAIEAHLATRESE